MFERGGRQREVFRRIMDIGALVVFRLKKASQASTLRGKGVNEKEHSPVEAVLVHRSPATSITKNDFIVPSVPDPLSITTPLLGLTPASMSALHDDFVPSAPPEPPSITSFSFRLPVVSDDVVPSAGPEPSSHY